MTDQTIIVALLTVGAFCFSMSVVLWGRGSAVNSALRFLVAEKYDPAKASLPVEAIPMHLGPELVRSHWNGTPVVLMAIRARGLRRGAIGRIIRATMRMDESCYDVDRYTVLVSLRGTSFTTLEPALRRFCGALQGAGGRCIDVGAAACPAHGSEVSQLVRLAKTSMIPAEDVLVGGSDPLIRAVTRKPPFAGVTVSSVFYGLIWVTALGSLVSVSQLSTDFMPIAMAVGISLALVAAGFVRDYRVPFPTWVSKTRRNNERERGLGRPRGELVSAMLTVALLIGTAGGALALEGRDARLATDISVVAGAAIVGVLGGRFLGSVSRWLAYLLVVICAGSIGAWWTWMGPDANDVAAWTVAACISGVCLGSLLGLTIRRPILVVSAVITVGIAATICVELMDLPERFSEIRSYVYIWTPGGVIRSGVGVVAGAAALGSLIALWRMPLMRVALSCSLGAALATVVRWVDGFEGAPSSAIIALATLAILGPVLAGRTTKSLKS